MASNIGILVLGVLGLVLNFESMIDLVGAGGILTAIIFVLISLLMDYLFGRSELRDRSVMDLGTAQRNIAAALVVAAQNFDADVSTNLMVVAVIGFVVAFPAAGEHGKRSTTQSSEETV